MFPYTSVTLVSVFIRVYYTLYYLSLLKKPSGYLNITLSLTGEKYKYIYSFFQLLKISIVKIDMCF